MTWPLRFPKRELTSRYSVLNGSTFFIEMAGDVDRRCICRFIEFREQNAAFEWNEKCPVHNAYPRPAHIEYVREYGEHWLLRCSRCNEKEPYYGADEMFLEWHWFCKFRGAE